MGTELMEEGNSMHIVRQFADIGCPTVANPQAKRGCWCIEEVAKQNKIKLKQQQQQQQTKRIRLPLANPVGDMRQYLKMQSGQSTVDMIQNKLILNARSQQYVSSNRMQQVRMQQMLMQARTGTNALSSS